MLNFLRQLKARLLYALAQWIIFLAGMLPKRHHTGFWLSLNQRAFKSAGLVIADPVFIDKGFKALNPRNISLGRFVSLGHDNHIWAFMPVKIGSYTLTAKDLLIVSGSHDLETLAPAGKQEVEIGPGCWIGARVTILGGVKIGRGAIIGACSLVNKDVPDFAVVGGVPAKVIRQRHATDQQWNPFKSYHLDDL